MKVIIGCFLLAFLACVSNLYGQITPSAIYGKVSMADHTPAEGSTIVLLKYQDSSIINSAIISKEGSFRFIGLKADNYILLVTRVGYIKSYTGPYLLASEQTLNAPEIILKTTAKQLKEISITGTRPDIEVKPGKIILNIQNSLTAAGSSVYDILRQSPGVRVDNSSNISISGRQSALVTIDGKPTNLTGEDLATILKGMQSSTIDYIELITSGSAKYDASVGGIINIVLKKGKNIGVNGSVTGNAGYGKYGKAGGGLVFNDRTDKFNIFGNYNYVYNKSFHNFTTDRIISFNNTISDYHVDYHGVQRNVGNTAGLGMDYFISPTQTIGFLINGSFSDDDILKNNDLKISNQPVLYPTIMANSNVARDIKRINYNLNYTGKLDKKGTTLSADFNYTTYNRSSAEYIANRYYDAVGSAYSDSLFQNLSPSNIHIWLSKVDFVDPLSKTSKLEAGLKYSDVISNNNQIFGSKVNDQYQSDPNFTNQFLYTENVNAAYVNYGNKFNKFDITLGLRAEQTIAKGNSVTLNEVVASNYTGLFPQMLLTFTYDEKRELSLSYNRGITRPAYDQINPFLYYIDPYDYTAGNPYLKPQYSNTIELSYNYNKSFEATLYSTIISNAYEFPFYRQNDISKVNINTHVNLGTVYNYGIRFYVPVVFTSWWSAEFNLDASYQRYVSYPVNGNLNKGAQDIIFDSSQHFSISKSVSAEVYFHYESPNFYGVNQFEANYATGAAIGKQLFSKRGSLKLNAADIFNTLRDRSHTNYQNLNMSTTDKRESQVVRLVFTYRFGKTSLKAGSHHTGNEDEQNRTKTSN